MSPLRKAVSRASLLIVGKGVSELDIETHKHYLTYGALMVDPPLLLRLDDKVHGFRQFVFIEFEESATID